MREDEMERQVELEKAIWNLSGGCEKPLDFQRSVEHRKGIMFGKEFDHIVVDVEIQKTIEETPGGWDATDRLGVSVAVVYEFLTDRYKIYLKDDVEALRQRLLDADRISGFNIWKFDFPVIFGLPGRERVHELGPKTNDILRRIWIAMGLDPDNFSKAHANCGLNRVACGTLGQTKSGFGGDAPKWYQQGRLADVINYCMDDVRIERDLAVFVERYGFVVHDETRECLALIDTDPLWTLLGEKQA